MANRAGRRFEFIRSYSSSTRMIYQYVRTHSTPEPMIAARGEREKSTRWYLVPDSTVIFITLTGISCTMHDRATYE